MSLFDSFCDSVATGDSAASRRATDRHAFERQSLMEALLAKGVRLTPQRCVVIEVIQQADRHLDVVSILELARKREPKIDRATVYRTIDLLKKLRLIDELDLMHLQGEKHYYEVRPRRDHVHLACFQCGRIEEFSSALFEQLKQEMTRETGFDVRVVRLEVGGRCKACRNSAAKEEQEQPAE